MPEGHVIHRLAAEYTTTFGGAQVSVTSPQGRFDAAPLDGSILLQGEAVGKHLFLDFSTGDVVHIHLGLIGKIRFEPLARPSARSGSGCTTA